MKHLKDRFKHYCCQLWWWDVRELLLKSYKRHYSNRHYEEKQRHITLLYCPYCGTEKPEEKHLMPFL
jgi:hypothetical protein